MSRTLLAVGLVAAAAAACGGVGPTAPAAKPTSGPPSASPSATAGRVSTPAPDPGPVPLGRPRAVSIKDDFGAGAVVAGTVTAHRFRDHVAAVTKPGEAGDHWAAVDVTACVKRSVTVAFSGWVVFDDGGAPEQSSRLGASDFPQPALPAALHAGCQRGWLTFEVADGAKLVVFALVQSTAETPPAWQIGG